MDDDDNYLPFEDKVDLSSRRGFNQLVKNLTSEFADQYAAELKENPNFFQGIVREFMVSLDEQMAEEAEATKAAEAEERPAFHKLVVPEGTENWPVINVSGRYLRDISRDALNALAKGNDPPHLFFHGTELVHVPDDSAQADRLSPSTVKGLLDRRANFTKTLSIPGGGEKEVAARPPDDVVQDVLRTSVLASLTGFTTVFTGLPTGFEDQKGPNSCSDTGFTGFFFVPGHPNS